MLLFWTAPLRVGLMEGKAVDIIHISNECTHFSFPLEFKRAVTMATLEKEGHLDAADDVGAL